MVATPLVHQFYRWVFAGEFETRSVLLEDERTLEITMVNNSDAVVFVHRIDFSITAEGTVHDDVTVTRVVTSSETYPLRLPDVLPGKPRHAFVAVSHALAPGESEKIEVTLLRPPSISVTGTYTLRPTLLALARSYQLEPVTLEVESNQVETGAPGSESILSTPFLPNN